MSGWKREALCCLYPAGIRREECIYFRQNNKARKFSSGVGGPIDGVWVGHQQNGAGRRNAVDADGTSLFGEPWGDL